MGPRTGLDDMEKKEILPLQGLELKSLCRQARSSRYTDFTILAHIFSALRRNSRSQQRYTECFLINLTPSRLCASRGPQSRLAAERMRILPMTHHADNIWIEGSSYLCSQIIGGVENAVPIHVNIFRD
jgi:hypothetical protein